MNEQEFKNMTNKYKFDYDTSSLETYMNHLISQFDDKDYIISQLMMLVAELNNNVIDLFEQVNNIRELLDNNITEIPNSDLNEIKEKHQKDFKNKTSSMFS